MAEQAYRLGEWESADGLTLRYRDYPGRVGRPPILCLHGLTRNARDFEPLAERFAGEWRLIVPDMRGRGESEYASDSSSYAIPSYVHDLELLLRKLTVWHFVGVGTSMGGLILATMAAAQPDRISGVVLNDIGPVVEPSGLQRIADYVGQGRSYPTWMHAARGLREMTGAAYPDFAISDWLRMAKRLMQVSGNGRITYDYDMKIAEPFFAAEGADPVDMWPAFRAFANRPGVLLRGELSDIISLATFEQMGREISGMRTVTVPHVGHAPTLEEEVAQTAIAQMLEQLA